MNARFELGILVAERQMEFESAAGERTPVTVRVGKPYVHSVEPRETWVCPFQVEGLGSPEVRGIFGIDSMQALVLCLHTIPAQLSSDLRERGGRFLFLGAQDNSFVSPCRTVIEYCGDMFPAEAQ